MKKIIILVLALLLSVSLVSCDLFKADNNGTETNTTDSEKKPFSEIIPEEASAHLNSQRQGLIGADATQNVPMFIAYLGSLSGSITDNLSECLKSRDSFESFPYLTYMTDEYIVDAGGSELYPIVPLSDSATVTVSKWICDESNGFVGENGDILYKSELGDPIMLRCNESDTVPNASVTIVQDSAEVLVDYTPHLSMTDGTVVTEGLIPDYSVSILPYGEWKGALMNKGGEIYNVTFEFLASGVMRFTYESSTDSDDKTVNYYSGTWRPVDVDTLEDSMTAFDCSLKLVEGGNGAAKTINNTLYVEYGADWVYLYYLGGEELIVEQEEGFSYGEVFIGLSRND